MPLIAFVSGYTSARASTAHPDAAASTLLLLAFAALVGSGWRGALWRRIGAAPPIGH